MVEHSTRHPDLAPTHPGETLKEDLFPTLGLSTATAAIRMGVSRPQLSRVVAGTAGVTAEMALKLGKLTGTAPRLWLNMQTQHDLWHAARKVDVSNIETASVA
jgi:addiction module HigA family antidote